MATTLSPFTLPTDWTAADLQRHLGGIPLERIRLYPPPGMATLKDVLEADAKHDRICELIDGVLVEKTVGYLESLLAASLGYFLKSFLETHDLGIVAGADGMQKILPDQVRVPDVSFVCWERLPGGRVPDDPVPELAPDLAAEILSKGNTQAEMQRKLRDYFTAGVRLVWYIDPRTRTATVYTAPDQSTQIDAQGTLSGGEVLPGFELRLADLFAEADRQKPK